MEAERLQKILSNLGVCSRRKAEAYILDGKVSVNGKLVTELGFCCLPTEDIAVEGKLVTKPEAVTPIYLAFNKPYDVVSTLSDPQGRKTVIDFIPPKYGRVFPIGRLDHNSTGLMLLTNDGELANLVTHPSTAPEKEYLVKVKGALQGDEVERLAQGLYITREGYTASPCLVKVLRSDEDSVVFSIILHEGKKREIRHMMSTLGHDVKTLMRIRIGNILLGKLPEGELKEIPLSDIEELKALCQSHPKEDKFVKDPGEADGEE